MFTDRQRELIDKYRDINVDHDWWDYLYDEFVEKMTSVGIAVSYSNNSRRRSEPEIYFSGFWSQGDGASFAGSIGDLKLFLTTHFGEDSIEYKYLMLVDKVSPIGVSWEVRGPHYVHSNMMSVTTCSIPDFYDVRDDYDTGEEDADGQTVYTMEGYTVQALDSQFSPLDFETSVLEIARRYADELYEQLEETHDALTEDDAVWDTIVANELDKENDDEPYTTDDAQALAA